MCKPWRTKQLLQSPSASPGPRSNYTAPHFSSVCLPTLRLFFFEGAGGGGGGKGYLGTGGGRGITHGQPALDATGGGSGTGTGTGTGTGSEGRLCRPLHFLLIFTRRRTLTRSRRFRMAARL